MTKLQEIKEAVAKVYPEMMELSFGCVFIEKGNDRKLIYLCKWHDTNFCLASWIYDGGYGEAIKAEVGEILGKQITLEHILGVINALDLDNDFKEYRMLSIIEDWTLGKDLNWHAEHHPETISFIHTLLFDM